MAVDSRMAWVVAVPAAALAVVAILLLGPPLGRVLFPVHTLEFWPSALVNVRPEPTEQARYLIALGGAVLVPLSLLAMAHRPALRIVPSRAAVIVAQSALVAVLLCGTFCRLGLVELGVGYFTVPTVAVAVLIGLAIAGTLRWSPARERAVTILTTRSRAVRWGAAVVAAAATVIWLLPAVQLDSTVQHGQPATVYALQFTFDEGLSVLNGHTPLVDYAAQYGSLWPYVIAIPLHFADGSLGGYTISMVLITAVAMFAVYGVIRRVSRSPLGALALFLPFLATSFFLLEGTPTVRYSFADYFGAFPLRYAGPYLVAYLLARHLDGARPRQAVWIFLACGFALMNNGDFGLPALGATVVALVAAADGPRTRSWWAELSVEAVGGLLAAYAVLSIVTLARTDHLPNLALLFRYARLFALAGYDMLPMPWFGFWAVVYVTFCAALALATIMAVRRTGDRTSTGMLAWIGIFGLGIGSYYAGRSHPQVLVAVFSAWSLAVALLMAVTLRRSVHRRAGVEPAQLALFVGFGLLVCSLAQFPAPWSSVERLTTPAQAEPFQPRGWAEFVAAHSRPGEPVALLMTLGQRVSRIADVDDVTPYTGIASMPARPQLEETLRQLREAGGSTVFMHESGASWSELPSALERRGFRQVVASAPPPPAGQSSTDRLLMFSDASPGAPTR